MELEVIHVSKVNEAFIKLHAERHILQEISDFFTFYVPGHQFVPAYRNRLWDGKIRLLDLRDNNIYYGLLPYIHYFGEERGYDVKYINPKPVDFVNFTDEEATAFINSLNIHSAGNPITVRDYQKTAFIHAICNKRAILLSPTASGKSLIIYLILRQLLSKYCTKGLIIVPTVQLVNQLTSDFADYSSEIEWSVTENVHKIYDGRERNTNLPITISTWQSLYKMPKEYFHQFDFVLGDETHLYQAKSIQYIMQSLINARYRIGLTGTLDGTKTHKTVLEGTFGKVHKVITTKELIDSNQLAQFDIKCLILKHDEDICKSMISKTYHEEIEYLIKNFARNKFIKNLALSLKGNTLLLYQYVDKHGKMLYDMISTASNIGDRKVFFIHGKVEAEAREDVRRIINTENNAIVIASFGTTSTGVNMVNLHNVIFGSPSKSRIRNLQSIGRGLRKGVSKESAVLYDIADDLRYGKHINHTLKHFIERTKIYNEEKFMYKLYKIGLKNAINSNPSS